MGKIWQPAGSAKTSSYTPGKLTSAPETAKTTENSSNDELAEKRVEAMMKQAVTHTLPESSFGANGNGGVISREEQVELARERKKKERATLSQWYGMKRQTMTPELEQEMQLLRYRALAQSSSGSALKVPKADKPQQFFETGYFVGTGRNRRRRLKSFADEWLEEDPQLATRIGRMVDREVKGRRKTALRADKRRERRIEGAKKAEERKQAEREMDPDMRALLREEKNEARRNAASKKGGGNFGESKKQAAKRNRREAKG